MERSAVYHYYAQGDKSKTVIDEAMVTSKDLRGGKTVLRRDKEEDRCHMVDEFILDGDHGVSEWSRSCPGEDTEFTSQREGDTLIIKGKLKGEVIDKRIDLGDKPLHVFPNYSLAKFAVSGTPKLKFWTLRRDEMAKLPMLAVNKGEETITINGKEVEAIRVYYAIDHKFKQKFYNRDFYYRKSDGMFLKKVEPREKVQELFTEE